MKFEVSNDKTEIQKVIDEAKDKDQNILWQTHADGRSIFEIFDFQLDPIREVICYKLIGVGKLDKETTVYLKFSHRNTIFKGQVQYELDEYYYMQIPDEVQLEELREFPRYEFGMDENRTIEVSYESQVMANSSNHESVSLIDVSQSGMALLLNSKNQQRILNAPQLNLSNLGHFEFHSDFVIDPVYGTDVKIFDAYGDFELYRKVGVRFREKLPERLLSNFVRYEESLFEYQIGFLGNSKKFRKKLHKEYQFMMDRLKKVQSFSGFLDQFSSVDTLATSYLPKHIRLLAMTSCALAKLIGIGDKTTYEQLTYAAFVHDIAYFNNPKLSQIKNNIHFEKVKKYMSVSERELFFRAPNYAYEFALSDKNAPAGSEFILGQYRDILQAADQEKFLASGGISPLVAVLMVAHDLTDYILSHPQWTFYDYLQSYKFSESGTSFTVIFEQLALARKAA